MADYNELLTSIASVIKTNNRREITGQILQNVLSQMVGSLGENYQLAGFATPSYNPQEPDQNVFYVTDQAGQYSNFDNITLDDGLSFLLWKNEQWTSKTFGIATHQWVDNNYVSKAFFRQLFRPKDSLGTEILANDTTSIVDNIQAMVGLWTERYLTALGFGTDGGGAVTTLAQLTDVQLTTPLANGDVLSYNTTLGKWTNINAGTLGTVRQIKLGSVTYDPVAGVVSLPAYPTIPTNVSAFTNDAGYLTSVSWGDVTGKPNVALQQANNNLIFSSNEFNFVPSQYSGAVYINYRTTGGTDGAITGYILCDGAGNQLGSIIHSGNIGSQSVNYANSAGSASTASYALYDWDGNDIRTTYLKLSGGTMTGNLTLRSNAYGGNYGLDCNNSDIVGLNSLYTNDTCDSWDEGIEFKRTNNNWDSLNALDGTFYFHANNGNSYAVLHCLGVYATSYVTALSDERHKDIIDDTHLSVEQIASVRSVLYRWNDGREDANIYAGSIAQDWLGILPYVVTREDDDEGTLSLQYGVAALIASITIARKVVDHDKLIKELKRQLSEAYKRIVSLEDEVELLKAA